MNTTPSETPKLQKPGAGIPLLEKLVARYWYLPSQSRATSWEDSLARFEREGERTQQLLNPLDEAQMSKRILIPRITGIEDSSRFWSPAMVAEHLMTTGNGITEVAVQLSQGRVPPFEIDIAKVKPSGSLQGDGREGARVFGDFVAATAARLRGAEIGDRASPTRHKHPWFGPITAHQWAWLLGSHQLIHRRQLAMVVDGLLRR